MMLRGDFSIGFTNVQMSLAATFLELERRFMAQAMMLRCIHAGET
jgi:hypothetical protein